MLKRILVVLLMIGVGWAFLFLAGAADTAEELPPAADSYVRGGPEDLGGANVVTSVVVTYRGLDTLGEVTVLFAAAAGVALVLGDRGKEKNGDTAPGRPPSEILNSAAALLVPLILLFGIYIFSHGHLTPGGGFQGGVVIASALLLAFLGRTLTVVRHGLLSVLEILAGAGYAAVGLLGIWLAAGFLDPRFLPRGQIGSLVSAGAIPVIYILIGIKVGAELSGVIDAMRSRE
jgi:multicomponent Na+:H+ antiporter subunit B